MNSVICFISAFHFFKLIQRKKFIKRKTRLLIYIGTIMPLGDYLLRLIRGDLWFFSGELIFHSFFFQSLFWTVIAFLYWVYAKDFKKALRAYFPLVGLLFYALFTFFSTEHLNFLSPFLNTTANIDWVNAGYIIPLIIVGLLWITKKWSELSTSAISKLSLLSLAMFMILVGFIRGNVVRDLVDDLRLAETISITPANSLQTEWNVVAYKDRRYFIGRYHFVQGWLGKIKEESAFDDFQISQNILRDPSIRGLYFNAFKNPVIKTELQNETISITISELIPSIEFLWVKEVQMVKNRSGRIMDLNVSYGSVY